MEDAYFDEKIERDRQELIMEAEMEKNQKNAKYRQA